ncbi:MAG: heme NO-binding domain-containing protein [Pseudomonadota bacterium]
MKGMVFTMLSEMIEERFGYETWDELIEQTEPDSEGIYVASAVYPHEELIAYVGAISEKTSLSPTKIVFNFGHYMLGRFADIHPEYFHNHTLKSFIQSVHDVIHVEVKKLHPDAVLPHFDYVDESADTLTVLYRSPRQLCALAEGLISGASEHFGTPVQFHHPVCMHDGADHCRIELTFK